MRKILLSLLAFAALVSPARADFTGKDASAATITFKNATGACTAVVCVPQSAISDSTGANLASVPTAGADAVSNTSTGLLTYSRMLQYNGTTWDRWQGAISIASGKVASGAFASGSIASGAMVDLGSQADSVCGTSTGSCSLVALIKYLNSQVILATPAGTNIIGKVGIDQTTMGTTNGVVNGASTYQAVAASQTATVLGSTGATGDYLSHCTIYPTSTSPGVVTVFDSTNTAANSAVLFPGGATSTSNLVPFAIPVGAKSVNGAWKVTTGAAVSVVCVGKFT